MARISLTAFRKKWIGKAIDWWSSSTRAQCVDLVRQWMNEGLGISKTNMYRAIPRANAEDFFAKASTTYFRKIAYRPGRHPPEGAIIVWRHGEYGHVAVAKAEAGTWKAFTLDQNWSRPHRITDEAHRYSECIGWLIRR